MKLPRSPSRKAHLFSIKLAKRQWYVDTARIEGLEGIIPNLIDSLGDAGEAVWPQDSKKNYSNPAFCCNGRRRDMKYNTVNNIAAISAPQTQDTWIGHKFTENTEVNVDERRLLCCGCYGTAVWSYIIKTIWNMNTVMVLEPVYITKSHSNHSSTPHNELPGDKPEKHTSYCQETVSSKSWRYHTPPWAKSKRAK